MEKNPRFNLIKGHPYYEYLIDLQDYQLREVNPGFVEYTAHSRDTFLTCLRKCGNKSLQKNRRYEVFRGSTIMLYRPEKYTHGYMLMTPRGVIWSMGMYGWNYDMLFTYNMFIQMLYACMNKAFGKGITTVTLRIPMDNYIFNKMLEETWESLGCSIQVRNSILNNKVLYDDKIRKRRKDVRTFNKHVKDRASEVSEMW